MIGNDNTWIVRGCVGSSVLALLMAAATCAAPDAQPSDEPVVESPNDASDGSDAADAPDAPDKPNEPPAGDPVWGVGFGEMSTDQRAFDVAADASGSNVFATIGFGKSIAIAKVGMLDATSARNVVLAKFNTSNGDAEWGTHIKCTGEIIRSLVDVDAQGYSIVAGGFNGKMTIGSLPETSSASNYDAYIAKIDPTGMPTWIRTFGETNYGYITDVAVDGGGNIIVVGVTEGPAYKFGTTTEMIDVMPAPASMNILNDDIFVAKFDAEGNAIWAKRLGFAAGNTGMQNTGSWLDPAATVAVSRVDGAIVVGGSFQTTISFSGQQVAAKGKEDGFIVKFDPDGKSLWHFEFGDDSKTQRVTSVAIAPSGEVFVTGSFQGTVDFGSEKLTSYKGSEDLLVLKLNPAGQPLWARGYGQVGKQLGSAILVDTKGQPVVMGSFLGVIDFVDNDALGATDIGKTTDIFAAKFSAFGAAFWGRAYGDLGTKLPDNQTIGGAVLVKDGANDRAIIVGMNRGTLDLEAPIEPIMSLGAEDAFMMSITY